MKIQKLQQQQKMVRWRLTDISIIFLRFFFRNRSKQGKECLV